MTDVQFLLQIQVEMLRALRPPIKCWRCEKPAIAIIEFVTELATCAEHLEEQAKVWAETHRNFIAIIQSKKKGKPEQ